jgi:hypothetical protein
VVIDVHYLGEPDLEFGFSGRHQEQRKGLMLHGPADIEFRSRPTTLRLGMVGRRQELDELSAWLERCASGITARDDTNLDTLFPAFPGLHEDATFRVELELARETQRELTARQIEFIEVADGDANKIEIAAQLIATEIHMLLDDADVDVVLIARPTGIPDGAAADADTIGLNFRDVLKAHCITARVPVQVIRPRTWTGGATVEDEATRAWNLLTALYYKCGGKPWRLARERNRRTRCYVGISFTRADEGDQLHTSVAQVFNELGDGVIVRGALARRSERDRQPHLAETDAASLLVAALRRYREHHGNPPAEITVHKTSSFSDEELRGFRQAADDAELHSCDLIWVTRSDDTILFRGSSRYPPLRGTLLALDHDHHALYTHGSVPYYKTYPGMYIPRPLGIRPAYTQRSVSEIAQEILALSKLNWNRARMDASQPITLLTARRVGEILRHVPATTTPAARYAFYM